MTDIEKVRKPRVPLTPEEEATRKAELDAEVSKIVGIFGTPELRVAALDVIEVFGIRSLSNTSKVKMQAVERLAHAVNAATNVLANKVEVLAVKVEEKSEAHTSLMSVVNKYTAVVDQLVITHKK